MWGRGALDMKSQTAAEVVAATTLARNGLAAAAGELKIIAVVDEETGGRSASQWLTEQHPDEARVDWLAQRGRRAGSVIPYGDRRLYGVAARRRAPSAFASAPAASRATRRCRAPATTRCSSSRPSSRRLGERPQDFDVVDEPRALLTALGEDPDDPAAAVASVCAQVEARLARWSSRRLCVPPCRRSSPRRRRSTSSPPRPSCRSTAACRRAWAARRRWRASARCSATPTASRSSSSRRSSATARRSTRR